MPMSKRENVDQFYAPVREFPLQGPVKLERMDLGMKREIDRSPCVILVARLEEAICQAEDGVEAGENDQGLSGAQKDRGAFEDLPERGNTA